MRLFFSFYISGFLFTFLGFWVHLFGGAGVKSSSSIKSSVLIFIFAEKC